MKNFCSRQADRGGRPYALNVEQEAMQNQNFRTSIWTGQNLQMTVMHIPTCSDIGQEIHEDTDQLIRIEHGMAMVQMGRMKNQVDFQENLCTGDSVFVPANIWHNIINTGREPLKLSSVYAPPHHPMGTVHHIKADAERSGNKK